MSYTKIYHFEELECYDCGMMIVENVEKLNFIKNVHINYDTKDLIIESNKELTDLQVKQVLNAILNHGHCHDHTFNHIQDVVTDEFEIDNIHCLDCANAIEEELNKDDHIIDAKVDFSHKKIIITHENNVEVYQVVSKIISDEERLEENVHHHHHHEDHDECDHCHHHSHEHHHEEEHKPIDFVLFFLGAVITVLAIIFEHLEFNHLLYTCLFISGYLLIGYDIIIGSIKEIAEGEIFNEFLLMVIASAGSLVLAEFSEAIMVMFLFKIGEYLQDKAQEKSRKAIKDLMDISVEYVTLDNGTVKLVNDVNVGEIIRVKVGERIPLDGVIKTGDTDVNMVALTGESIPTFVGEGEEIISGSINLTKVIDVEVTKISNESTINKVMKLAQEAQHQKSRTEEFINKFAKVYTPIVLIIAVLVCAIELIIGIELKDALNNMFTILVIACPCALVISIPLGYFSGIGVSSVNGILVKGGNYLEALSNAKTFVFDKTGTITKGNFKVVGVNATSKFSDEEIVELIAKAESYSMHPIAKSIEERYGKSLETSDVSDINEIAGAGIKTIVDGKTVLVGNNSLMKMFNIDYIKCESVGTIIYLAVNNEFAGSILIADEIKPESNDLINYLKDNNYETVLLTGDNKEVALDVASKLGIEKVYYSLMPNQKLDHLKDIINTSTGKVAYIGDGINDSPALSIADVGIAMGGVGSDIAKESADIVIMNDDLNKIPLAILIAKQTKRIVLQNIIFALAVKLIALVIGALGILSSLGMIIAVFSDVGVCLLAILNSLRLLYFKPQKKLEK